jgi:hypothetical protein
MPVPAVIVPVYTQDASAVRCRTYLHTFPSGLWKTSINIDFLRINTILGLKR